MQVYIIKSDLKYQTYIIYVKNAGGLLHKRPSPLVTRGLFCRVMFLQAAFFNK